MNYIDEIIDEYLNSSTSDYAYILNGKWGTGKTYFIKNKLIPYLKEGKKKKILYYSLNGASSISNTLKSIYYLILSDGKINQELGAILSDGIQLLDELDTTRGNTVLAVLNKFKDKGINIAINKMELSNYFIILDDLERISSDVRILDLLGQIYTELIDKNIKVLLISDESRIREKKEYDNQKEKFIRRTINFKIDYREIFENLIKQRELESDEIIISTLLLLVKTIEKRKLPDINLRSIIFSLDIYKRLSELYKKNEEKNLGDLSRLYYSIVVFCIDYKEGQIPIEHYEILCSSILGLEIARKETQNDKSEKEWYQKFYEKYNSVENSFHLPKFILDYIVKGHLDEKDFIDYFEIIPREIQYEDLSLLASFEEMEYEEINEIVRKVLTHIEERKYRVKDLEDIYERFAQLRKKIELEIDLGYLEKIMLEIVDEKKDEIRDSAKEYSRGLGFEKYKPTNNLQKKIYAYRNQYIEKNEKDEFEKLILSLLNDNLEKFRIIYQKMDTDPFFEKIVKFDQLSRFKCLSNCSIYLLKIILNDKILKFTNAGDYNYSEKAYLSILVDHLENENQDSFDKMKIIKYKELISTLKKAIDHLEETKRK